MVVHPTDFGGVVILLEKWDTGDKEVLVKKPLSLLTTFKGEEISWVRSKGDREYETEVPLRRPSL